MAAESVDQPINSPSVAQLAMGSFCLGAMMAVTALFCDFS
jgi:hypothetical protein